jgi:hypothetical protein
MASLTERMLGAARLDVRTFEEVEADQSATGQAMLVVVLAALATGIGAYQLGSMGILFTIVLSLVRWFAWAFLTYFVGTKILPEPQTHADLGQMLRVQGFSAAPGILGILGVIPFLGVAIALIVNVWQFVAMLIAVKSALDYRSIGRAVGVVAIGFVLALLCTMLLGVVLGVGTGLGVGVPATVTP